MTEGESEKHDCITVAKILSHWSRIALCSRGSRPTAGLLRYPPCSALKHAACGAGGAPIAAGLVMPAAFSRATVSASSPLWRLARIAMPRSPCRLLALRAAGVTPASRIDAPG